jgi:hypothetical protein
MAWESKERRTLVRIVGPSDNILTPDAQGRALVEVNGVVKPLKVKAIGGVYYVRKGNDGLSPVSAVRCEQVFGGLVEKVSYSFYA